ncbi:MAG: response regulator [bacterium]
MNNDEHHKTWFVAEDSPRDREYLLSVLPEGRLQVYDNGAEAFKAAREHQAPCLISDLQMKPQDGVATARALWGCRPQAKIVFWTQYSDEVYLRNLAGLVPAETVYGYLLKSNPADVLLRAVKAVFEEEQCWVDPKVRATQVRMGDAGGALTDMEYEALVDISLGLTDGLIAKRRYLSRRGVQSRLKSLYIKLGVDLEKFQLEDVGEVINPRARAVNVALRRGLINAHELEQEEAALNLWLEQQT